MTHIDLFSGIGSFALAASWVWQEHHRILAFCEKDKFCQKVLKKHWPDVPICEDIHDLKVDRHGNLLYNGMQGGENMPNRRDAKYDNAVNLYESGLSIQDCANFYGVTRQAMHKALQVRGCTFRSQKKRGVENHFYRGGKTNGQKRAGHLIEKALKKGIIERKPCEQCGANGTFSDGRYEVQAHHEDYNKPLDVRWLCQRCHHEWHKCHKAKEIEMESASRRIDLLTGGFP